MVLKEKQKRSQSFYQRYIKRQLDIWLALIAFLILLLFLLLISAMVRIFIGSPVIFKQKRPGRKEKLFTLYKFRTMLNNKDENGNQLPDEKRLTRFGSFLRSTSLDELPEVINVIKGDMSLVGPRPLLVQYLPLYSDDQRRRHEVRPGLTGLAQINGRNLISWEDKFRLDVSYVDNITFRGDMKIILYTIKKVWKKEGIGSNTSATVDIFKGSEVSTGRKLLILGAGGHGKVAADIAMKMKQWDNIAFLDDNCVNESLMGMEIIGTFLDYSLYLKEYDMFVAVGNNASREQIQNKLETAGASLPVLIHPGAIIGTMITIGKGSIVMAGSVINCCSYIGKGCIINTGATVDHDCVIEDFVHLSPGVHIAGMVKINTRSWLGIGSIVINNKFITGDCIVGAGAIVVKDINEPGTYIGIPAKKLNKLI